LTNSDHELALSNSLVVVDCSWTKATEIFSRRFKGNHRRLPALMAGNPTNYSKLHGLSSLEAAAASLYIMGFESSALRLLSLYKWGDTFFSLNENALKDYIRARSLEEINEIEEAYFAGAKVLS
jgi:pre-rRNA-processing protein TSR3